MRTPLGDYHSAYRITLLLLLLLKSGPSGPSLMPRQVMFPSPKPMGTFSPLSPTRDR